MSWDVMRCHEMSSYRLYEIESYWFYRLDCIIYHLMYSYNAFIGVRSEYRLCNIGVCCRFLFTLERVHMYVWACGSRGIKIPHPLSIHTHKHTHTHTKLSNTHTHTCTCTHRHTQYTSLLACPLSERQGRCHGSIHTLSPAHTHTHTHLHTHIHIATLPFRKDI